MNKKSTLLTLLAAFSTISAFAPPDMPAVKLKATTEVAPDPVVKAPAAKEPFAADEWVVGLGANYSVAQPNGIGEVLKTDAKHGDFGASIGVTKFISRNFGIGIEAGVNDAENIEGVDYANVFVVARTPLVDILPSFEIARNIAPYAVLGAGHDFHTGKQTGFFGGGVEYRFTPRVGAFIESRFVFAEQDNGDASVTRLGVRFAL